jgi:hypothetical protein
MLNVTSVCYGAEYQELQVHKIQYTCSVCDDNDNDVDVKITEKEMGREQRLRFFNAGNVKKKDS